MIIDDLYAQGSSWAVGHTAGQFTDSATDEGRALTEPIDLSAYYLGWVDSENLPCFIGESDITYADGVITCTPRTIPGRYPAGYMFLSGNSGNHPWYVLLRDGIRQYGRNENFYLFNQLHPEYYGLTGTADSSHKFYMYFMWAIYDSGQNAVSYSRGQYVSDNFQTFFDLLHDETDTTYIVWDFGTYGTIQIKRSTFRDKPTTEGLIETSNGYFVRMFLCDYRVGCQMTYNNGIVTGVAGMQFFIDIDTNADEKVTYINTGYSTGFDWNGYSLGYYDIGQGRWYSQTTFYNADDQLDIHSLFDAPDKSYVYSDHLLAIKGTIFNIVGLHTLCTFEDVRKSFDIAFRIVPGTYIESYVNNQSWATDVSAQDEFLFRIKTGNITDPAFKNTLREWQYTDFQGNEFTAEDIPEPIPPKPPRPDPEPPDKEDENSGDDITLPSIAGLGGSFGFTTQYALNGSQLQELGQLLWAGFSSTNPDIDAYLQNFVYRVDLNTGSVNMADIMEFFISLRAYPLPLGNLTTVTAAGNDFYIGSGANPLAFTSTLHTSDCYLAEIDAGSVSVPFWFGDYRDYACEITLYLPYCGTAELNAGDVMGGTLDATYVVDLSTGSCTAYVMLTTWDGKQFPVAILPGQLGVDIPITASNAGRVGARLLGDRINVAENLLSVAKSGITGIGAMMSGNYAGALRSGIQAFLDPAINEQRLLAGMGERGAIAAPMLSGGRGLAAFKNPATAYVQIRSPFYAVPDNFADAVGDPAAVAVRIGDCAGFNQFYNVDVSGITTDAGDQMAIRQALESGIII